MIEEVSEFEEQRKGLMKINFNNKYVRWGLTAFCVIVASICFYYLMFHGSNIKEAFNSVQKILRPVIVGFVLAYLMSPIMNQIEYRMIDPVMAKCKVKNESKMRSARRAISVFLTILLVICILYALIGMFISQIVPSIMNLVSNFDSYVNNVTQLTNRLLEDNPEVGEYATKLVSRYSVEIESWLNNKVLTSTSGLIKTVSLSVISLLGVLWNWIIGFIISIYLLASKEKFAGQAKKMVYAIFETDTANTVIRNFRFTHKTFIGFISGKVLDSIIIGLLCFIGTTILKTPYAALVSLIVGVTNVIPFFGPYLGAVPTAILIFLVDPSHPLNCVYFVIFILVLQQFDGNILGPKILGDSTGLTGFWVIFAITLFGGAFGVLGMIVGVPIFAVIYAAIRSLVNTALIKKKLPKDTTSYITVEAVDEQGVFHEYTPDYIRDIQEKKQKREDRKDKQGNQEKRK